MKLEDLIDELQSELEIHGNIDVVLVSDYGDISHTKQALPPVQIDKVDLIDSAYSASRTAVRELDDPEAEEGAVALAISAVYIDQ